MPKRKIVYFQVRLTEELHARLAKAAKKNNDASLNSEIVRRLEQSLGVKLEITSTDLAQAWIEANDRIMALEAKLGEGAYRKGAL